MIIGMMHRASSTPAQNVRKRPIARLASHIFKRYRITPSSNRAAGNNESFYPAMRRESWREGRQLTVLEAVMSYTHIGGRATQRVLLLESSSVSKNAKRNNRFHRRALAATEANSTGLIRI